LEREESKKKLRTRQRETRRRKSLNFFSIIDSRPGRCGGTETGRRKISLLEDFNKEIEERSIKSKTEEYTNPVVSWTLCGHKNGDNTEDHLSELHDGNGKIPLWRFSASSESVIQVHESMNGVIHSTENEPGRVVMMSGESAIPGEEKGDDVMIPVQENHCTFFDHQKVSIDEFEYFRYQECKYCILHHLRLIVNPIRTDQIHRFSLINKDEI